MQRERVSENVYWFQSDVYAQVTAGVVVGPQWALVIDTLALPEETLAMRSFIEEHLNVPVRYIVNTHYHADHTWGNCFFPGATIISHTQCRKNMVDKGQDALEQARKQSNSLKQVKLVLPHITFSSGNMSLRVGKKNLILMPFPGHSDDAISVLIEEDRVLFAGDVFMNLPYIVDGDLDNMRASIHSIAEMGLENIIQGHGDIILRGEIEEAIVENLRYLDCIEKAVRTALKRDDPGEYLAEIDVEACGKSRVLLGGLAQDLHQRNLVSLYKKLAAQAAKAS